MMRRKKLVSLLHIVRNFKELSFQKEDFKFLNELALANFIILRPYLKLIPSLLTVFSSIPAVEGSLNSQHPSLIGIDTKQPLSDSACSQQLRNERRYEGG
jgi:hypothetical protein